MNQKDNLNLAELTSYLREEIPKMQDNLSKIERAIYGDVDNGVSGLIDYNKQTQLEMQKIEMKFGTELKDIKVRVGNIEKIKNKIGWAASGLVTGASIGGASIWEWITKMK